MAVSSYIPTASGWESCGGLGDQRWGNEGCPLPFSLIWKLPPWGHPFLLCSWVPRCGLWGWSRMGDCVSSTGALEISQTLFFSTLRAVSEARRVLLRKKEHLQCSLGLAGLESHPELCFRAWPECGRTPPYQNLSPIQVPRLPAEGVTWSASLWWNFAPTQTPNLCLSGSNI